MESFWNVWEGFIAFVRVVERWKVNPLGTHNDGFSQGRSAVKDVSVRKMDVPSQQSNINHIEHNYFPVHFSRSNTNNHETSN